MATSLVFPVIHHKNNTTTLRQAALAANCGADGVFLISHTAGEDGSITPLAEEVKGLFPALTVGINLLSLPALVAWEYARDFGLDAIWADECGVSSAGVTDAGRALAAKIKCWGAKGPQVFAGVAFKYQAPDTNPAKAAATARALGMVPATSGAATGQAPSVQKIASMSLDSGPLAIASGMTPENVSEFAPHLSHILVSTGVSRDFHRLDEQRLSQLIAAVRAA